MTNEILMFGLTQIAAAAAVYAAIRADMREYAVRIAILEEHNRQKIHICK